MKFAEEHRADFVVMGRRKLSGLKKFFVGSVSDYVVKNFEKDVIVCRPGSRHLNLEIEGLRQFEVHLKELHKRKNKEEGEEDSDEESESQSTTIEQLK